MSITIIIIKYMNTVIYNNPNEKQFETFKKNSIVKIDDTLFISDEQNILKRNSIKLKKI